MRARRCDLPGNTASLFFSVVKARASRWRQIFQVIALGEVLVRRLKKLAIAALGADRR